MVWCAGSCYMERDVCCCAWTNGCCACDSLPPQERMLLLPATLVRSCFLAMPKVVTPIFGSPPTLTLNTSLLPSSSLHSQVFCELHCGHRRWCVHLLRPPEVARMRRAQVPMDVSDAHRGLRRPTQGEKGRDGKRERREGKRERREGGEEMRGKGRRNPCCG